MSKRDFWTKQFERAQEMLNKLDQYGEDDYPNGTILVFDKQFTTTGAKYSYAFLKANGLWYSSGPKGGDTPYTWEQFVDFLSTGVDEIFLVTDMERIYPQ